jgi:uncharacterized protein (TIGR03435 family)
MKATPSSLVLGWLLAGSPTAVWAQPPQASAPAAARPKFDVASIKPCKAGTAGGKGSDKGSGSGSRSSVSPGRLDITCMSVPELIDMAYVQFGNDPLVNDSGIPFDSQRIRGVPAWAQSARYTIDATTDDSVATDPADGRAPASKIMKGPMLQALLQDRFQLSMHRVIEEVPMYALTVAKGGLKLKPMEAGGCTPLDPTRHQDPFPPGQKPLCITHVGSDGPNWTLDAAGRTLSQLAWALSVTADRHVIDRTGIGGLFIFHLVFERDENTPGGIPDRPHSDVPPGPSVFTVLEQQLGLKLVPDKGPRGYVVIDHVERPSQN